MDEVILSFFRLKSPAAVQGYLALALNAPAYYGRNLDALYDLLSTWGTPIRFVLRMPPQPRGDMASYLPRLLRVFEDAAAENPRLKVQVV